MPTSLILVGLGMAALGVGGRIVMRTAPKAISNMENVIKSMPSQLDSKAWANSKFYKGGFEPKMTKREVKQIFEDLNIVTTQISAINTLHLTKVPILQIVFLFQMQL